MSTPPWIHKVEIDYRLDSGKVQTLYAELESELHEQVVAAQGHENAENAIVTVYARLSPTSDLAPRLLRGSRIVRVEPI